MILLFLIVTLVYYVCVIFYSAVCYFFYLLALIELIMISSANLNFIFIFFILWS